jgi:ATP phosphoribosyltransferase regulatory subunit HisZ
VADPKYRQVVPMRYFNLTLSAAEAEAYNAAFLEETSLRADVARTLIRLVSILARVSTEMEEMKRSQSMSSLWKLHADALVALMDMANSTIEDAATIATAAQQGGFAALAATIQESAQKLRARMDLAAGALAHAGN